MLSFNEVSQHATARSFSPDHRARISFKCHMRIPADPNSDEYAEQSVEVLESRKDEPALTRRIRDIVDSVVREETAGKREAQTQLNLNPKEGS